MIWNEKTVCQNDSFIFRKALKLNQFKMWAWEMKKSPFLSSLSCLLINSAANFEVSSFKFLIRLRISSAPSMLALVESTIDFRFGRAKVWDSSNWIESKSVRTFIQASEQVLERFSRSFSAWSMWIFGKWPFSISWTWLLIWNQKKL